MTLLPVLLIWAASCSLIVYLNARFWKLMPDTESGEGMEVKAKIKPLYEPINKGKLNWMDWITIIVVLAVLFSCSTMRTGYYEIKEIRGSSTVVFRELPNEDYHVPRADTLRVGQKIHLKRVFKENQADVW